MPPTERITSRTGGQKDKKLAQLGALDPLALLALAEIAGAGAEKYDRYNFLKGYDWSLSYDACQRHLNLFWAGDDLDEESGQPHLAHAAWHCLAMLSFHLRELGDDDRFVQPAGTTTDPDDGVCDDPGCDCWTHRGDAAATPAASRPSGGADKVPDWVDVMASVTEYSDGWKVRDLGPFVKHRDWQPFMSEDLRIDQAEADFQAEKAEIDAENSKPFRWFPGRAGG